jgi:hypothetical protein
MKTSIFWPQFNSYASMKISKNDANKRAKNIILSRKRAPYNNCLQKKQFKNIKRCIENTKSKIIIITIDQREGGSSIGRSKRKNINC